MSCGPSADELRQVLLSLPVSVCLLDRNIRYLAANYKYAQLCGSSPEELVGKSMLDFCPDDLVKNALRDFSAFDAGKKVSDHEIVYKNGPFLVAVNPIYRDGDTVACAIAVALTDISELKAAETTLIEANAKLSLAYQQMQEFAETDALTKLANRHGLDRFFDKEIRRCKREGHPIAVLLLDIDHFKSYNDRFGHLEGDACLQAIAKTIQTSIRRPGDCAARYGGEEFVIVLPNTALAGATHVSRILQKAVANLSIEHGDSPFGRITLSIGVAGTDRISREKASSSVRDDLLRSADLALYQAKNAGRNGVAVWGDELRP